MRRVLPALLSLLIALPGAAQVPAQPEAATGLQAKPGWSTRRFAEAAANPLAAEAGYRMLKAGGSAIDAAVAVQMVLNLVEPQSSGIGGGAFLLMFDGKQQVSAWDGRESAPAAASPRMFLDDAGKPLGMRQAIPGGLSAGVPGVVAMLAAAHRQQGVLPWKRLFEPAIELAEQGFAVSPRLHQLLAEEQVLRRDPQAGPLFYDAAGEPRPVGYRLKNPALAAVLRGIAERGPQAFYEGPVAADIARRIQGHARPGPMAAADLAAYKPVQREPLCAVWLTRYRVCGFPPPSSGQLTMMQILKLIEARGEPERPLIAGKPGVPWLHLYSEAARLAFADRAQYIADPDFVPAPAGDWQSLLAPAYLKQRAALIGPRSMGTATAGRPGDAALAFAAQAEQPEHGTSHISIVDAQGRALAMTTSIESAFGDRIMSDGGTGLPGGFLLNNTMTDFSLAPADADGKPIANRVEPGKRPRSSMSPTLVFDARNGQLLLTVGAPGGPAIIHFVAKTLIGALDWGLDLQRAVDLPNYGSFNTAATVLEAGGFTPQTLAGLRALGHQVVEMELTSGLQGIQRSKDGWFGAADPRREGVVRGD
ncbi:gamma-glutamyltransferase [Pelomonas sp. KK5]|uniref:gamma-glutamyltransferase n=1 Tax=Pelomonas sp. KK5 TaxID=1855730 RepID=UPI00097BE8B7|nr:gamma-glutamyltransferase [Pelomonas sp. KK5]